jgi:purine nucleosidase
MSIKLLLDTDIGSDIDDAMCLAYLLAQPECELLGVTTVSGEAERRAMIASAMCKNAGKDIPIYPGADHPLIVAPHQPHAPQADVLGSWEHETTFPQGQAISFLQQTIRAHPGEVVLLAIGPMTNVGLLFQADPEIPGLLKELVLMCGVFQDSVQGRPLPAVEWNALNDPHAAAIVYRAPVVRHRSIGLDVTRQVQMNAQEFLQRCQVPLLRPVIDFAGVWFQHHELVTFHDPLAATTIFDESICTFARGTMEVEMKNEQLAGKTYWHPNVDQPRHEAAFGVDPERFFAHYFSVFSI